jgi:tRNA dimethylallyltransferase
MEVLVIVGPTASGKTAVGIEVARQLNGEIVSADTRQIYRHMDIGTAKPTLAEQAATPHHMIDVINPDESFDAAQYGTRAAEIIEQILVRGRLPILVGGAGFYLEALFRGFSPIPRISPEIRSRIQSEADTNLGACYARLAKVDLPTAERFHPTDRQRVTRALEVFDETGHTLTSFQAEPREPATRREATWIGLQRDRQQLYDRIDLRARLMVELGLEEEVRWLLEAGYGPEMSALRIFGYAEFLDVVKGVKTREAAAVEMQQATRQYAKRQLSWFRNRVSELRWIPADEAAEQIVSDLRDC